MRLTVSFYSFKGVKVTRNQTPVLLSSLVRQAIRDSVLTHDGSNLKNIKHTGCTLPSPS